MEPSNLRRILYPISGAKTIKYRLQLGTMTSLAPVHTMKLLKHMMALTYPAVLKERVSPASDTLPPHAVVCPTQSLRPPQGRSLKRPQEQALHTTPTTNKVLSGLSRLSSVAILPGTLHTPLAFLSSLESMTKSYALAPFLQHTHIPIIFHLFSHPPRRTYRRIKSILNHGQHLIMAYSIHSTLCLH